MQSHNSGEQTETQGTDAPIRAHFVPLFCPKCEQLRTIREREDEWGKHFHCMACGWTDNGIRRTSTLTKIPQVKRESRSSLSLKESAARSRAAKAHGHVQVRTAIRHIYKCPNGCLLIKDWCPELQSCVECCGVDRRRW